MGAEARPSVSGGNGHHTHSASSSVSGVTTGHARRESENEPHPSIEGGEPKKREAPADDSEEKKDAKKRRIAPTQVGS
jgi:chromatin assembly factor 1 subunit B